MSILDSETILASLSYDELSASILASLAVGLSDGKVTSEELQEITNIVHKITGFKLGHDEVWAITLAAWHHADRHGSEASIGHAAGHLWNDPVVGSTVISLAAAVAYKGGGIGEKEGNALRTLASYVGVAPDSDEYFAFLGDGQQLAAGG